MVNNSSRLCWHTDDTDTSCTLRIHNYDTFHISAWFQSVLESAQRCHSAHVGPTLAAITLLRFGFPGYSSSATVVCTRKWDSHWCWLWNPKDPAGLGLAHSSAVCYGDVIAIHWQHQRWAPRRKFSSTRACRATLAYQTGQLNPYAHCTLTVVGHDTPTYFFWSLLHLFIVVDIG